MDASYQANKRGVARRFLPPVISVALGCALLLLIYRHLVAQAFSQGFVLEELHPAMDAAIGVGRMLYWLGGRPLFAPAVLALLCVLASLVFAVIIRKARLSDAMSRWLAIVALAFSCMYVVGGTTSFALYLFALVAVPVIGLLGRLSSKDAEPEAQPASRAEKIVIAGLMLFGLILGLYRLDVFPYIYAVDEQLFAQSALEMSDNPARFLSDPSWEKVHLVKLLELQAGFSILGVGMFQQRTLSVIESVLCIPLAYLLCRRMWGNAAGVLAAFMVALEPWQMGYSKFGHNFLQGPLFLLILLLLTSSALRTGGKARFALLGVFAGATTYLYQSCLIMGPFVIGAVFVDRCLIRRNFGKAFVKETLCMAGALIVMILPHVTFGRANLAELFSEQTMPKNFLASARDYGVSPVFMLFVNFWRAVENVVHFSVRPEHPSRIFYLNVIMVGLALLGLGILLGSRKRIESRLLLAWLPVAFLPISLGYGFADRRLFATLAPVPAMLAALPLAKLWVRAAGERLSAGNCARATVILFVIVIMLTSVFIVYEDVEITVGGARHPRKAAEFVRSIPPDYTVLISNLIKDSPFLLYITNYDKLTGKDGAKAFSFVDFENLGPLAEKIAMTPRTAVVVDTGPGEEQFLAEIKKLNPKAEIIKSDEFWACLVP